MDPQQRLAASQFGRSAELYAVSSTHNDAAALADLVRLADPRPGDVALDVATGPGTVALELAPLVASVVASDLTPAMLEQAEIRARERGIANLTTVLAAAEDLPFPDASFDIVTVRTAPHHFSDVGRAVREMARVVRPDGRVVIVDTCSPEDPGLDRDLNAFEELRDPSHVRNYTPTEWRKLLEDAGLAIGHLSVHTHALGKRLMFREWVARMHVDEQTQGTLKGMLLGSLRQELQAEAVGDDLSFTLPEITILAVPIAQK